MNNPWQIYDDLIDSIPDDLTVLDCLVGLHWTLVRCECGLGAAMSLKGGREEGGFIDHVGWPLKTLAARIKSWNLLEASLGQAAINAALNTPAHVELLTGQPFYYGEHSEQSNGFDLLLPEMRGKKVAVIGHFPNINKLRPHCQLSILERSPQDDDYPDSACEYILPEQDIVFITGTALINKTMPRLIELARRARTILVGPSVPISPVLFDHGIDTVSGTVLLNHELVWNTVKQGGKMKVFRSGGQMVSINRP
ncbi:MAG: Rossmann-like domain-containing protein [Deltaproteobacteria bacterium]